MESSCGFAAVLVALVAVLVVVQRDNSAAEAGVTHLNMFGLLAGHLRAVLFRPRPPGSSRNGLLTDIYISGFPNRRKRVCEKNKTQAAASSRCCNVVARAQNERLRRRTRGGQVSCRWLPDSDLWSRFRFRFNCGHRTFLGQPRIYSCWHRINTTNTLHHI